MIIRRIPAQSGAQRRRVAAYCRVSTLLDGQEESFAVQRRHYERRIRENGEWEYAGVYGDCGLSGAFERRPGFARLVEDVMAGKIDVVLVKSISRFSRNAVECQRVVRRFRARGARVLFEKEGIDSMDASSDLIFNLRAAFAQEESRMIGENVRWTYRRQFEMGVYHMGSNRALGYDEQEGVLTPNADAAAVRLAFEMYASGAALREICLRLEAMGAHRLRSSRAFTADALRRMLGNELYAGDLRPLKSRDQTQVSAWSARYWRDHHAPIVDRETWEVVQARLNAESVARSRGVSTAGEHHPLYGRLFCADCGAPFKRRTLRGADGAYYKAWNCRERQKGRSGNGRRCPIVREDALMAELCARMDMEDFDPQRFAAEVSELRMGERGLEIRPSDAATTDINV